MNYKKWFKREAILGVGFVATSIGVIAKVGWLITLGFIVLGVTGLLFLSKRKKLM